MSRDLARLIGALAGVAAVTFVYTQWLHVTNATIVALSFLVIVLITAAVSRLWVPVTISLVAMGCFNFFFLPAVGTLTIADPENWVALFTFLAVSLVASNLSSAVRARAQEALDRRDEMARLFDLSRDVLLMTDSRDVIAGLPQFIARRFDIESVSVCLPHELEWEIHRAGASLPLDWRELADAFAAIERAGELDEAARGRAGRRTMPREGGVVQIVPLHVGSKAVGVLATAGRSVEEGTLDAIGAVAAIAIERAQLLEERKAADLARQSEELKSALLASLGHDLRTPLTAIRLAASNLQASWLTTGERAEQSAIVLVEVERLTRLFQNILDMARIDAGAVSTDERWVHPSEIVRAARDLVIQALKGHPVSVDIKGDVLVKVDPRLTAAALSHVLENAAQYSAPGSPIEIGADIAADEMTMTVRDHGPGISVADLPHLFDRFYRGRHARQRAVGTGMGLSIAQGLIAAERGRIRAENCPGGGAQFTMTIAAESRLAVAGLVES